MDRLSRKIELESRRIESELGKIEPSSGKEKLVLGNANQLPDNVVRLLGKANPETKTSSVKAKSGPSHRCGLQELLEPISGEEGNEESVTKKSESRNVGSPVDEERIESMKDYVIPRSEKEGTKPPYVCPGCSNHTYSNNMITRIHVQ
jgi:hypothetical protein